MAKTEFARGTLLYNLVEYGVTDITVDDAYSEIDVTDTLSTLGYSEFLGGRRTINVSFNVFKLAGVADIVLNQQETDKTSGALVVGAAYRLTDWITDDNFMNVGAASNADGVEFIASGTTPTHWTHASIVTRMNECTLTLVDSGIGTTSYSGNLILLTKGISGTIDDAVKVAYTGRITGTLTES